MKMSVALVDVIVPTYKRADCLVQALASVRNQNFSNWICYVSEDGDDYETGKAVSPYLNDEKFVYITSSHLGRPAGPRNRAIIKGSSKYIAFLDDDDYWFPEKLEKQLAFMEKNEECCLLSANAIRWNGEFPIDISSELYLKSGGFGELSFSDLLNCNRVINSSAIIRRSVIQKIGLINESAELKAFEDYEFWIRIASIGKVVVQKDPLIAYRDSNPNSIRTDGMDRLGVLRSLDKVYESTLQSFCFDSDVKDEKWTKYLLLKKKVKHTQKAIKKFRARELLSKIKSSIKSLQVNGF